MPEHRDPFESLRRPVTPLAPRRAFAATLRRRLEEEVGMPRTEQTSTSPAIAEGALIMVHLQVPDADRAIRFFGDLFGWEAERAVVDGNVSYYVTNTALTVRLLSDPDVPPVVPNFAVTDVGRVTRAIEAAGGVVGASEVGDDGGGWARAEDDQGVPLLVFRPHRRNPHPPPTQRLRGDVGLVFIRADAERAARFYRAVFGWTFERANPGSQYFHTIERVGVFDEAAASGHAVEPSITFYVSVASLDPVVERIEQLGGSVGPIAQDMGSYVTAMCTDDQGTEFGLMAEVE